MSQMSKRITTSSGGQKMKTVNWSTGITVTTFLVGVILLLSFGKEWINFSSPIIFLVALTGVAIPVLIFAAWKISNRPPDGQ
jgi:hypothetical protein